MERGGGVCVNVWILKGLSQGCFASNGVNPKQGTYSLSIYVYLDTSILSIGAGLG